GKTWTIAVLYVRLVLGHGEKDEKDGKGVHGLRPLMPQDILVMTFTRAATRELSDRIRARLTEAAQVFRNPDLLDVKDTFLEGLLGDYADSASRENAAYRLSLAAQAMDDAAVYTIDAWCQRMLREHAFDSGNLFEESLVADEAALRLEAVQDYWREQLYPMDAPSVTEVLGIWRDVAALEQDMHQLLNVEDLPTALPGQSLGDALARAAEARAQALAQLKRGWPEQADALLDWLGDVPAVENSGWKKRSFGLANCSKWLDALKLWAQGEGGYDELKKAMGKTGWERFTPEGMASCREDDKPYTLPPQCQAFADLQAALQSLPQGRVAARIHARTRVAERLAWLKQHTAQFGFADMLQRLNAALQRGDDCQRL
ncbi:MAG: UvrD-helicase domain-containing protein, partial [Limnohabitans sp.]